MWAPPRACVLGRADVSQEGGRAQPAVPEDSGNKLASEAGHSSSTAVSSHRSGRGPWVRAGHVASVKC